MIYPVDPDCPRFEVARLHILDPLNRDGQTVREMMGWFVYRHTAICWRCIAYNAAKGPVEG